MKKIIITIILVLVICLALIPTACADYSDDTLTVNTMTGDYVFRVGDTFTYYYWLQLSVDTLNYTADQINGMAAGSEDSALINAVVSKTDLLKTAEMKNINGAVYFDTDHLDLVEAEMPNLKLGTCVDISGLSTELRSTLGADSNRNGIYFACPTFIGDEKTQYDTDTMVLVKCTFRVKRASDEPAHIRTRLATVRVQFQTKSTSGSDEAVNLVKGSKAYFAYESYDTINEEEPTIMLKALVADQGFEVKCILSSEEDSIYPGEGVQVNMMGVSSYGQYMKYTGYTPNNDIIWFYDVEYGTYYGNCGWVSEDGKKFATKDAVHAEVVNVPASGSVQALWLFAENDEEVEDIDVYLNWVGDDGYLPVRPSALTLTILNANNNDMVSTLYANRTDEKVTFYGVAKSYGIEGMEPIDYMLTVSPSLDSADYKYETEFYEGAEGLNDYFIVTCTYKGKQSELNVIPVDEHGHYWKVIGFGEEVTCETGGTEYLMCDVCRSVKKDKVGPLEHNWGDWRYNKDVSCDKNGTRTHQCQRCYITETEDDPDYPMLGHEMSAWARAGDATCTDAGTDVSRCTRKGCTYKETRASTGTALGHVMSTWESNGDATCERDGTESRHCTRKGCTYTEGPQTVVGSALGHSWGEWGVVKVATCTTDAVQRRSCQRAGCGEYEEETIADSALGHDWTAWKITTPATCDTNAVQSRECDRCDIAPETREAANTALGHLMANYVYQNNATCTQNGTCVSECSRHCGYSETVAVEGTATGHSWSTWLYNNDATDTEDGTKTCRCTNEGCTATRTVTDEGSCTAHHYGEYISDNNASCTHCGTKTATCTDEGCGSVRTIDDSDNQPMLEHDWTEWQYNEDATCIFNGTEQRHCEDCGTKEVRARSIGALGHNWGAWKENGNATCVDDGTHTRTCTRKNCGVKQTEISKDTAKGHDFGEYIYNNNATCYKDGTETSTCRRADCGYCTTRTRSGTMRSHDFGDWIYDKNATCTSNGTETRCCRYKNCKGSETREAETGKLGHVWGEWSVATPATCTSDAVSSRYCQRAGCGAHEDETITGTALGHEWGEYVYNNDATCQHDGTKTRYCQRAGCGKTDSVAASGTQISHNYVNGVCTMCFEKEGTKVKYTLNLSEEILRGGNEVYIDGVRYTADSNNKVYIYTPDAKTAIVYTYNKTNMSDPHTVYPTHMYVYTLTRISKTYIAAPHTELTDILQYAGSSIRIKGEKGIRMITGIPSNTRDKLINRNIDGYTLQEYGTILAWDSDLQGESLTRESSCAKGNYAYSRIAGTDPIYEKKDGIVKYTNVIVGISNEKCVNDLSMRSYMVLEDTDGNQITLYGGIIHRSIGYIAYQNRNAFSSGTAAYDYVWNIIHYVYGTEYDNEYKG